MNNPTDEQLVEAYLKGDSQALNLLIKRYLTPIFNYALSFVKDAALAEDIAQEVFVKAWKKIKKFNHQYKFKNWLYAIAKNTCLDYFKKNKTINFSELDFLDDNLLFENLIKEAAASPQAELARTQAADMVRAAVAKLPEIYKKTIKLHYLNGFKFREVAAILKESIETVKSRNRRALICLKKLIKR